MVCAPIQTPEARLGNRKFAPTRRILPAHAKNPATYPTPTTPASRSNQPIIDAAASIIGLRNLKYRLMERGL
jgi:hypothetical protein